MSKHQAFGIYLITSGFFWYLPILIIFWPSGDISLGVIGGFLKLSIFPVAYAWLGYLQAEQVVSEIVSSKFAAVRMSLLSLLGGAIFQSLVIVSLPNSPVLFLVVPIILFFGFLPALFAAGLFVALCE